MTSNPFSLSLKIRKISNIVLLLIFLVVPVVLFEAVRFWFFNVSLSRDLSLYFGVALDLSKLKPGFCFLLSVLGLLPVLLGSFGALVVFKLFIGFRKGEVFTMESASRVRQLGVVLIATPIVLFITSAALSILLSYSGAFSDFKVAFVFKPYYLLFVITGVVVTALGWVLLEAVRIAHENDQFI